MATRHSPAWYAIHQPSQASLWHVAVLFYGVGDVLTTSIGLQLVNVVEAGPFTSQIIQQYGLLAMVSVKLASFAALYAVWRIAPRPHRTGVPLGLSLTGVFVTVWNCLILLLVVLP